MDTKTIPAQRSESVFGRQAGSMTIRGDIVHTDDIYAEGIQEMAQEWDELYGSQVAGSPSPKPAD
ncbi:MAG: hypothetical protein IPP47_25165 [Bryobacterales bacterium]|nr:hypothetical protein [Bryobacterales bacterium]